MKKRTAFIGAILSLIPFIQPLINKTGIVYITAGLMIVLPQKVFAVPFLSKINEAENLSKIGDFNRSNSLLKEVLLDISENDKKWISPIYLHIAQNYFAQEKYFAALETINLAIENRMDLSGRETLYAFRATINYKLRNFKESCSDARLIDQLGSDLGKLMLDKIQCDKFF